MHKTNTFNVCQKYTRVVHKMKAGIGDRIISFQQTKFSFMCELIIVIYDTKSTNDTPFVFLNKNCFDFLQAN